MAEEKRPEEPKDEGSRPEGVQENSADEAQKDEDLGFDLSEIDLFGEDEDKDKSGGSSGGDEKEAPEPQEAKEEATQEKDKSDQDQEAGGPALGDLPEDPSPSEKDLIEEASSPDKALEEGAPPEEEGNRKEAFLKRVSSLSLKNIVLWLAVALNLIGIVAGLIVAYDLLKERPQPDGLGESALQKPAPERPSPQGKAQPPETSVQHSSRLSPPPLEQPVVLTYDLPLRTFLLPYRDHSGRYIFVKVSVTLLFGTKRDYLMAKEQEIFLRETVYEIISQIPVYLWQSKEGMATVIKTLKSGLRPERIRGIQIKDISLSGEIFK
ncbi:hypothetical protein [Thermosulfuriphilus sp.]